MVNYRKKNWELFVTRNMSLFHVACQIVGYQLYSKNYGVVIFKKISIVTENGKLTHLFDDVDNDKEYSESIIKICLSNPKLYKLQKNYKQFAENLLEHSKIIEKDFSLAAFKNFVKTYEKFQPTLALTAKLGRVMHAKLIDELSGLFPGKNKQKIEYLVNEITYPEEHTPLFDSQISLLKIGSFIQGKKIKDFKKDEKVKKLVLSHSSKYRHIPIGFNDNPWSEEDINYQLEELLKINCKKEIYKLILSHKSRIGKAKKTLKKISNKKISQISISLKIGTTLNEFRKNVISRSHLSYAPLFNEIAKTFHLDSWREILKLTPDEIFDLYYQKNKNILKILKKRKIIGIEYFNGRLVMLPDKIIKKFINEIPSADNKTIEGVKELTGTVANKGMVRGKVKVILGSQDFHKFNSGDVIVATMTSVDFVPIMKLAAAFITNEGGITSHASIVSRELNKPCIIGTKIATKVLKDGMMVGRYPFP